MQAGNQQSRDPAPPSTCDPLTHRRGWSKEREEAGEKVGVLCVLLEEGDRDGGEDLSRCTATLLQTSPPHLQRTKQHIRPLMDRLTFSPTAPGRPSSPSSPWWRDKLLHMLFPARLASTVCAQIYIFSTKFSLKRFFFLYECGCLTFIPAPPGRPGAPGGPGGP